MVIMGCGHEDATHTVKKRFENRRSGGQVCGLQRRSTFSPAARADFTIHG